MQAAQVNTIAANPVRLLRKLCDVEGATAIKTESFEHSTMGRYDVRVIADIGNGVYVEVIDYLAQIPYLEEDETRIMCRHRSPSSYEPAPQGEVKQEVTENDKLRNDYWTASIFYGGFYILTTTQNLRSSGNDWDKTKTAGIKVNIPHPGAFSFAFTLGASNISNCNNSSTSYKGLFSALFASNKNGNYGVGKTDGDAGVGHHLITNNLPAGVTSVHLDGKSMDLNNCYNVKTNCPPIPAYTLEENAAWPVLQERPLGIYTTDRLLSVSGLDPIESGSAPITQNIVGAYFLNPFTISAVSYSAIRVACAVDDDGELVNPSPWEGIPIFPKIRSDGNGCVAFYSDAINEYGGGVICGKVDTGRGNRMEGNYAYVLRNYTPSYTTFTHLMSSSISISAGETPGKFMNLHVPQPPIYMDSVTGGPVVSDVFLYDDLEVRGIANGVLGCGVGLPGGYTGWMDGKRYRMLTSGIMIQW